MKKFLILSFILISISSSAQSDGGFYGKKNALEFNTGWTIPVFQMLTWESDNFLFVKDNRLKARRDFLNFSLRGSFMHATSTKFAIGFEYSRDFGNITGFEDNLSSGTNYYEQIPIRSNTFLPKLEFATGSGLLPVGLSHQIGVGFSSTSAKSGMYSYYTTQSYSGPINGSSYPIAGSTQETFTREAKALVLLYEMHVKTPVSKVMTINYGFRYNANIPLNGGNTSYNSILWKMRRQKLLSIIYFNIGLGIVF